MTDYWKREQFQKDQAAFAAKLEWFINNYRPEPAADSGQQFERAVYELLEWNRRLAQEPLIAQMAAAMALASPRPFIVPEEMLR